KQSVAWTVVSKPECTDRTVRATCTGWKPVPQMHGQDCPCHAGASARRRRYESLLAFLNSLLDRWQPGL
ncbi:MAG: hypothetical protein NZ556_02035, partial [Fimbriimonadales bacterium]|nr:hypothetical protein [Fimbriimonadales bacterium]